MRVLSSCALALMLWNTSCLAGDPVEIGERSEAVEVQPTEAFAWGGGALDLDPSCNDETCCPEDFTPVVGSEDRDLLTVWWSKRCVVAKAGRDTVWSHGKGPVVVFAGDDRDVVVSSQGGDSWLFGQGGSDTLVSHWARAHLYGGAGDDHLIAAKRDDELFGNDGDDHLDGNKGDDTLEGGAGDDFIQGGSGDDFIVPGPGGDKVYAGSGDDEVAIYDVCELERGETLDGGRGYDILRTPLSKEELRALGVKVRSFEEIVIDHQSCRSECVEAPDCVNGTCVEDDGDLGCDCEPGWGGDLCDQPPDCEVGDPNACNGHGECVDEDDPHCECEEGYTGPNCDIVDVDCIPGTRTGCNDRGLCQDRGDEGGLSCLCDSGFVGRACEGSVRHLRKKKNAGPDEFELLRLPDVRTLGTPSACVHRNVNFTDDGGECTWETTAEIRGPTVQLSLLSELSHSWDLRILDAGASSVDPGDPAETEPNPDAAVGWDLVVDKPGTWTLEISTGTSTCAEVEAASGPSSLSICSDESDRGLYLHPTTLSTIVGESVGVTAYAFDLTLLPEDDEVAPEPVTGEITSALAFVRPPSGIGQVYPMFPDASGGRFTYADVATAPGDYAITVEVRGQSADGRPFEYERGTVITVIDPVLEFNYSRDYIFHLADDPIPVDESIRLDALVRLVDRPADEDEAAYQRGREIFFSGEVYGLVSDGITEREVPVAWVGNLTVPTYSPAASDVEEQFDVSARLDPRWVRNAKALLGSGEELVGLVVRNALLQNAETMIPVDTADGAVFIFDDARAWLDGQPGDEPPFDPSEHPEMLDGAPPEFVDELIEFFQDNAFPVAVGDLVLVHGWCAGPQVWNKSLFDTLNDRSDRGNVTVFRPVAFYSWFSAGIEQQRPRQVRVTRFADELVSFLTQSDHPDGIIDRRYVPGGIVAHSQGGPASLWAYSQNWTPLDAVKSYYQSNPERALIQTLDSPFGGSGLMEEMGLLGLLGGPIGSLINKRVVRAIGTEVRGCEVHDERTEIEPTLMRGLMKKISRADRSQLTYQVSGHRKRLGVRRYCNWFTSKIFLLGRDDGAVETRRQDLKHANAHPFADGRCHTSGMFYGNVREACDVIERVCGSSFMGELTSDQGGCYHDAEVEAEECDI